MILANTEKLSGHIFIHPSKSYFQRAVIAAFLSKSPTRIIGRAKSEDSFSALDAIKSLGAKVQEIPGGYIIESTGYGYRKNQAIHCGESGLLFRLMCSLSSVPEIFSTSEVISILADGSLLERPMEDLVPAIEALGGKIRLSNGKFPPAKILQPIRGGQCEIKGENSSQFLSGLLMATPLCRVSSEIRVSNLVSRSYIDLTLNVLKEAGILIENDDYKLFKVAGGQRYNLENLKIEGDWSNAAFWAVAAALFGEINISGVDISSLQGDRAVLSVIKSAGAEVSSVPDGILVKKGTLKAFQFDATDTPDLFPPLVLLASFCKGISKIKGVHRLAIKESNREKSLISEFSKLGITLYKNEDTLYIEGNHDISKMNQLIELDPHNDHRLVMALALAGAKVQGKVKLKSTSAVNKSYPDFFDVFQTLGGVFYE